MQKALATELLGPHYVRNDPRGIPEGTRLSGPFHSGTRRFRFRTSCWEALFLATLYSMGELRCTTPRAPAMCSMQSISRNHSPKWAAYRSPMLGSHRCAGRNETRPTKEETRWQHRCDGATKNYGRNRRTLDVGRCPSSALTSPPAAVQNHN